MKIFVTGGAGYIGSHVVYHLLKKGHQVTVFDDMSTGTKKNIFPEVKFIKGNILNQKKLSEAMIGGYDAVMHFAAKKDVGESMENPNLYSENNITGTINVLKAMEERNIKKIIFSSSAAVYGIPEKLPVTLKSELNPNNYYGYTKLDVERIFEWLSKLGKIQYAALRYFNAGGYDPSGKVRGLEKNPQNLLPVIMEVATGKRKELLIYGDDYDTKDGSGVRDYIHVTDLADAHIKSLSYLNKNKESLVLNLGSGQGYSVKEVLERSILITKKMIPAKIVARRPGDAAALYTNSKKARKMINYKPKYSDIDTIIKTMWEVYK
ncbi:UDP-glucose 4-epimerase GalE [Patescibacteria group bacterium]|nr:UDP-glucose 4-epimerase GalE [Patescibacteria group bacterium]MBU1674068.1 UDP-glucose 4-epimerase GalE [Patescibacteria group bacterium]MBU1963783.1 UDP-glucose 4-epimerase GalE [Patescibacteria group bacterium]